MIKYLVLSSIPNNIANINTLALTAVCYVRWFCFVGCERFFLYILIFFDVYVILLLEYLYLYLLLFFSLEALWPVSIRNWISVNVDPYLKFNNQKLAAVNLTASPCLSVCYHGSNNCRTAVKYYEGIWYREAC